MLDETASPVPGPVDEECRHAESSRDHRYRGIPAVRLDEIESSHEAAGSNPQRTQPRPWDAFALGPQQILVVPANGDADARSHAHRRERSRA